ncbi:MAG: hypothetical protein PHS15_07910 [Clostridiaceae bacterium]|nr:hypothetical protein [Clostridiaceae bacterium]
MKKYDTIIFGLDGTLLDTLDYLTDSVNYSLGMKQKEPSPMLLLGQFFFCFIMRFKP